MTATYYPDEPYTITTAGLNFLTGNDDSIVQFNLGFTLTVGEVTSSTIYLSNNGYIMFGDDFVDKPYPLAVDSPYRVGNGYTENYIPVDLNTLALPMFAGLWYDIDTRNSGTTRYGSLTINGQQAFRAVWTNVGAYDRQPYYSTFAMTIFDVGKENYHLESHVSVNNAYQWTEPTRYPSPTVTIGLALGAAGVTPANINTVDLSSAVGRIDAQWRGRANTNPGLYVFTNEVAADGWGLVLS